jgi:hypothetical protein
VELYGASLAASGAGLVDAVAVGLLVLVLSALSSLVNTFIKAV